MTRTTKAIRIASYGGPEVLKLEDVPRPVPGKGEVLIRVHAAGINPLDWKVREGHARSWLEHKLPLIPGWDVSGTVEALGEEVTGFKRGDAVYGLIDVTHDGAYAEYCVAKAKDLARKPVSCDHTTSASIPIACLSAWQSLFDVASLSEGQTVLIHAAAGGVGHFAVQLAKWKGAKVIGVCSNKNANFVKELGADQTIDYTTTRFEDAAKNVDVVLDTQGGETQARSWKTLKKGGMLVSTLGISSPQTAADYGVRAEAFFVHPDSEQLTRIATLIDTGKLKPVVSTTFPLKDAAKAHELSQSGHVRGKIVLRII